MKVKRFGAITCMLALILAASIAGAQQNFVQTQALEQAAESQAVGRGHCASRKIPEFGLFSQGLDRKGY